MLTQIYVAIWPHQVTFHRRRLLSHLHGSAIRCLLGLFGKNYITRLDSVGQELRAFSWRTTEVMWCYLPTKAAACNKLWCSIFHTSVHYRYLLGTAVECIVGNLALNLILTSRSSRRHVLNERRPCSWTSFNKNSQCMFHTYTAGHGWGIFCVWGHQLSTFVWLVYFYVFCKMLSAFVWWSFWIHSSTCHS